MSGRLQGRIAIVTGGGSGIGYATVERFAEEGAAVLLTDWSKQRGGAAAQMLQERGYRVDYIHHDAGDESMWRDVIARVQDRFGGLHILVNNAYSGAVGTIGELTTQSLRDGMRVNVEGAMIGMRLASEAMTNGGAIVNLASIAAFRGSDRNASYAAAKLALVSLTQSAAVGFARRARPIRVNAVAPGYTRTVALERTVQALNNRPNGADLGPDLARFARSVPLGRLGEPRELANAILFLVSDEASYVTGQCLAVDGGALVAP
jgi:NAD(P)-dependent dehydrogenase (short-subunit alcohol dehydrogenase family)